MSKNDFKEGMEAGAKPFEEKFQGLSKQTKEMGEHIEGKIDSLGNVMDIVLDDLTSLQKKNLYDLNTPFDIKEDLEPEEKELLSALLLKLASTGADNNEYQQKFIRSVNHYMEINQPQMNLDISCIENIESIKAQKAIMQVAMEYLYLEDGNFDFLEEYVDSLFGYFSVNDKGVGLIKEHIQAVAKATGKEGISQKYGYVPEEVKQEEEIIEKQISEEGFSSYDGKDISEACADQININKYFVLKDYLVYVHKNMIYRVSKQTGEKVQIPLPWEKSPNKIEDKSTDEFEVIFEELFGSSNTINICGCDKYIYLIYYSSNEGLAKNKGIYQIDVETFQIDKVGELLFQKEKIGFFSYSREFNPQCNEKYLVYHDEENIQGNERNIIVCINLKTKEVRKFDDINNHIILINDSLFYNENNKFLCRLDLITGTKEVISNISQVAERIFDEYGAHGVFQNHLFYAKDSWQKSTFSHIDLHDPSQLEQIVIPNVGEAIFFTGYNYIYYIAMDSSIGRYDILTDKQDIILNKSKTLYYYTDGFLKKRSVAYLDREKSKPQIVGNWLYYVEGGACIHKVSLKNKTDTIFKES